MSDSPKEPRPYYHLINGIRGFALLNMLLFHFSYDIFMIFGADPNWYRKTWVHVWQQCICITFLFLSGIAWHFGHNNLRKGLLLNLLGLVITGVTLVFLPSETVWFGILNVIGCATLLLCVMDKLIPKGRPAVELGLSLLLFLLFRQVSDGYLGLFGMQWITLPEALYRTKFLVILGFPYPGFRSSDYFPILPWSFLVMAGYWFWELVSPYEKWREFFQMQVPIFSTLGRRTIWIYMLHQPVLYGIAYGVNSLLK